MRPKHHPSCTAHKIECTACRWEKEDEEDRIYNEKFGWVLFFILGFCCSMIFRELLMALNDGGKECRQQTVYITNSFETVRVFPCQHDTPKPVIITNTIERVTVEKCNRWHLEGSGIALPYHGTNIPRITLEDYMLDQKGTGEK